VFSVAAGVLLFAAEASAAPVVRVVELSGYRARFDTGTPASVRYLLIDPANASEAADGFGPIRTTAVLMLLVGGNGRIGLAPGFTNIGSPNFLARTRVHFAAQGFVVAVVDTASDFLAHTHAAGSDAAGFEHGSGLIGHRLPHELHGNLYVQDLQAVMGDLRTRYPELPLWAVGTSRGTVSAAVAATAAASPPDGLVLTSSLTGPDRFGDLSEVSLEAIRSPVLIVTHKEDGCATTRPEDSRALRRRFTASARVQVLTFEGGSAPLSDPCDPYDAHGYFGVEQKVIDEIAKWMNHAGR
jgi:hypothetical protein